MVVLAVSRDLVALIGLIVVLFRFWIAAEDVVLATRSRVGSIVKIWRRFGMWKDEGERLG